jgi:hypothetical protein
MKEKNCLTLDKEFLDYCKLNKIEDVEKLARETFNKGFTIVKYGETPFGGVNYQKMETPITLPLITRPASRPIDPTEVVVDSPKMKVTYESTNIPQTNPVKLVSIGKENDLYDE